MLELLVRERLVRKLVSDQMQILLGKLCISLRHTDLSLSFFARRR